MATTRTAPAARPVAAAKSGSCRLASLPRDEAKARLLAGMAIELRVRFEGEPADLPPHSYWLALETPANATPAYRLTKVEEEDGDGAGAVSYRLGLHRTGRANGCSCPDNVYRGAARPCKHRKLVTAVVEALALVTE